MNKFKSLLIVAGLSIAYPVLAYLLLPYLTDLFFPVFSQAEDTESLVYLLLLGIPHNLSFFISAGIAVWLINLCFARFKMLICLVITMPLVLTMFPFETSSAVNQYQSVIHIKDLLVFLLTPALFYLVSKLFSGNKRKA
ncbi:hypothetical protein [Thalassotalea sp. PS06]|uniref:hypothetical protein n=1 Tax=Thalassotalea sp. PS06 TaxID=2594005 RepID=UPI001163C730|nr:hypothetical protein [Thalassotalea sp. PS06]QDP01180.1 hypothetical protein FNC98_07400 [Thalassotalea sp. PS06]